MKQLFFAGSFAIATFLAYGLSGNSGSHNGGRSVMSLQAYEDTVPGKKKDSLHKKKNYPLKDSTVRKDSLHPGKDTTIQQ
ncbi:MAG: hypothetical protein ABUT20_12080 [Bacteroidota bacterium]